VFPTEDGPVRTNGVEIVVLIDLILAIAATFFLFLGIGWTGDAVNERRRASLAGGRQDASRIRPSTHRTSPILPLGSGYASLAECRKTTVLRK